MKKEFTQTLKILLTAVVLSLGISYAYAWTAPTLAPPDGNTSAPLNTGYNNQSKLGKLILNTNTAFQYAIGLEVFGDANFYGTVKLADTGDICDSSSAGRIRYDGLNFFGCTEDNWESLTTVSGPYTWLISGPESNFNMADRFNLSESREIILTIDTGVTVSSTNVGIPALATGDLPQGSTLTIINNGYIVGKGGAGGKGGDATISSTATVGNGIRGENGGISLDISLPVIIDNTNGYIYGGGGGGGGGGGAIAGSFGAITLGGGGAGAGAGGGIGGGGGVASGSVTSNLNGYPGGNGTTSGGGGGGGRTANIAGSTTNSGSGGDGGNYGSDGKAGADATSNGYTQGLGSGNTYGNAGKAINTNNNLVTFTGGDNTAQVKGAVN